MRFFGLRTCDTCRKALVEMRAAGLAPTVLDIRADGIAAADRAALIAALGDRTVNRASTTWRALDPRDRDAPLDDLLARHPTVIKRPVIERDGQWFVGWDKTVRAAVLGLD
jgi:arsenate reductase-like glutaredoxin family protein